MSVSVPRAGARGSRYPKFPGWRARAMPIVRLREINPKRPASSA